MPAYKLNAQNSAIMAETLVGAPVATAAAVVVVVDVVVAVVVGVMVTVVVVVVETLSTGRLLEGQLSRGIHFGCVLRG